ncbi:MAG: spore coat U domain-containing protein [Sphingomonas adhaesiva]|uniref:Csu type fimbrial protein n=1 Tax=Sphingomonas adhaesiva TaxID=28212 RepID=UPI002FF4D009
MRPLPSCALPLALIAAPAAAETAKPFEVSARILPGCLVATDAGGRWGTIDMGQVAGVPGSIGDATLVSTAGAGLSIECTPGLAVNVTADTGDHPASGERRLQRGGGTDTIPYRLFADGSATPWAGSALPLSFATGGTRRLPVRARATLTTPARAGTYTDTVRITLTW